MKKLVLAAMALFALGLGANAQNINTFKNGDIAVNVGLGLGTLKYDHDLGNGAHFTPSMFAPSINVSGEYGFMEVFNNKKGVISGGLFAGIARGSEKETYTGVEVKESIRDLRLGTRGALHYQFIDQLDMYAGLALYIDAKKYKATEESGNTTKETYKSNNTKFGSSMFAGVRYMLSESFGLYSEVSGAFVGDGDQYTIFQIGAAFKF